MSLPIEDLTPRQIVAELDRYIVGQNAAKKAVAVALRNRYRRQQLPADEREDIMPKNILMIGPTGVGKTEIARRLAQLARAPFIKVEATKFTEVGYVGRDVESMIRDLTAAAVRLVEREKAEDVREEAEERAFERLASMLDSDLPVRRRKVAVEPSEDAEMAPVNVFGFSYQAPTEEEEKAAAQRRKRLLKEVRSGKHDQRIVAVEIEEAQNPFVQVFSPQGMEEMGIDTNQMGGHFPSKRHTREVTISSAKEILIAEETKHLIDKTGVTAEAINRAEQTGIIFLDEIDKVASKSGGSGPDVSREGVQRDLLPIIEGSTVATKFGPVRTDHILFIAAGAFHMSKPSDLIPELQGRLPIRVELESLTEQDFRRILHEPKNALSKQYVRLLETEGIKITFSPDAFDAIANLAAAVNEKTENIGARRLHTMMERLLEEILYEAPELPTKEIHIDGVMVEMRLSSLVNNVDASRRIL